MNTFLFIKTIAFTTMLIDHIGYLISNDIMRGIGRISMPLFALLMAYGTEKTKHPKKRCLKLLATAIISFPIAGAYFNNNDFNIVFSFFVFALLFAILKELKVNNIFAELYGILVITLFAFSFNFDYSFYLILLLYVFYKVKDKYVAISLFTLLTLFYSWFKTDFSTFISNQNYALYAIPFILIFYITKDTMKGRKVYNSKVFNFLSKNIFYILYPLHIFVLYIIKYYF